MPEGAEINLEVGQFGAPHPRSNPEFVGHAEAEVAILEAYRSGRLAHAWLLTGPPGIGKATLAYRFARYMLINGGSDSFGDVATTLDIAADAPAFRRVAVKSHADLLTIEATPEMRTGRLRTEISVGDVRAAGSFLRLTSAEGGWRVIVVDSTDELTIAAANALLKMLEEPPSKTLLLLVSNSPGRLLATIRSRCRRLMLRRLNDEQVTAILLRHRPDLTHDDAMALGRLAGGSPGRALRIAEHGGVALYGEMLDLVSQAPRVDTEALHTLGDRMTRAGAEPVFRVMMDLLSAWLANLVRCGASGDAPGEVIPGENAVMQRLLDSRKLAHWADVWEKVAPLADRAFRVNLDRKQVVISAFAALGSAPRS